MSKEAIAAVKALRAPDGAWEIPLIGEVDGCCINGDMLLSFLSAVKPTDVKFIIRSPGGMVYDILDAIDYMKANGIKAYAEVYGDCMSAATLIAAYCTPERTAVSLSARFGIHKASGMIGDQVFVQHANERIQALYKEAYGWSTAKSEKLMTANNGTGTVWMGDEIVKAGIADEQLDELKVAAHMQSHPKEPTPNMGKTTVQAKAAKTWENITAFAAGNPIAVEIDASAELETANQALAQATSDRQAAEAKVTELTDAEAAAQAKITELTTAKDAAEAAKVAAETTATEVTAKLDTATKAITAKDLRIAELEKLPTAKATKAQGGDGVQEPGASGPVLTDGQKQVKSIIDGMTPGERSALKKAAQRKAEQTK